MDQTRIFNRGRRDRMIKADNITKKFDDIVAVDRVSAEIKDGSVFGLIGTNGAGKSTFLRMISGILKPDEGSVTFDGEPVYENEEVKGRFFYISDDQYYFNNATPTDMMNFYSRVYKKFDRERFRSLMEKFGLDMRRKIQTFSKGMKKQLSVICGICANTDYLLCDETFDGLDPVMRQAVKSLFANDMAERNLTPIIASHNLRELEDICDHVGLLHRGGILLSRDLDDMKLNIHKVQCVLKEGMTEDDLTALNRVKTEKRGKLYTLTVRGSKEEVEELMDSYQTVFYEMIPLSLEEIFISETEVAGYDIKKLIF
jgi:ABC-2 type transport system ATP-binding protein